MHITHQVFAGWVGIEIHRFSNTFQLMPYLVSYSCVCVGGGGGGGGVKKSARD